MTAKFSASSDGTKVNIGNAAEDALQIDSTAKTIKALAPYTFSGLTAVNTSFTPTGDVAATNVQAAIAELDTEKVSKGVYESGQIIQQRTFTDAGGTISGTTIQAIVQSTKAFTPKSNNSTLLITVTGGFNISVVSGINTAINLRIYENTVSTLLGATITYAAAQSAGGLGITVGGVITIAIPNTAFTTRSFGLAGWSNSGSAVGSSVAVVFSISEIQN